MNHAISCNYVKMKIGEFLLTKFNTIKLNSPITSYNVCYTKLLRISDHKHHGPSTSTDNFAVPFGNNFIVITSYSIHYTKLYELSKTA